MHVTIDPRPVQPVNPCFTTCTGRTSRTSRVKPFTGRIRSTVLDKDVHIETTNEACHGESSVSGKFLKGHTFKTITVDSPTRCQMLCSQDVRCQSYNFIIGKDVCELNNRTKEARPQDFADDPWRFYMKGGFSRGMDIIHLEGSINRI